MPDDLRLRTSRLALRNWREEDREAFAALNADPQVALDLGGPLRRADSDAKFDRYVATGDDQISLELVEAARYLFSQLCASQRSPRLLHGDLQHYNVLFDSSRGWVAIDPKGVVGELEYEIGAIIRNPVERPELFLARATIERRLRQFTSKLNLDYERMLAWSFAQAVLSSIWEIEDGFAVDETNSSLRLAKAIRPMLGVDLA